MANEFIIKNGFHSNGNSQITGSLNVSSTLTVNGSAVGSAFPFTGDAQITGSLVVSGAFEPHGNGLTSNVIIGKDAAPNIKNTSDNNVFIGNEVGGAGTLSAADGNVCIGYQAGKEIDGGDDNVCIGNQAGYLMDGPTGTVAIGSQVMRDAINNYGVGVGHYAGRFQRNNPNTLVGANAGYGVNGQSDARYNSCFGYRAGYLLRDGYYNTILGDDAGYSINNGYGNVFIGSNSGYNVTDGTGNIIIGSGSLAEAGTANQLRIGNADTITISASLETGDIILQNTTVTELTASKIHIPITTAASQDLASNTQYSVNGSKVEVRAITAAQVNNSLRFEFKLLNTSIEANSIVLGSFTGNHTNSVISGSIISVATIAPNTASVFVHNETGGNIAADTPFTASFIVL
tara:strand:- start:272 stop:1480 length:1209 start_codon:yes stop_codon:yes gene_type:complete